MSSHALPAPFAISVDVGEPHLGYNFALCVDGRRQPANVTEIALHMRMQV